MGIVASKSVQYLIKDKKKRLYQRHVHKIDVLGDERRLRI